jgi:hypothetical protein
MFRRLSKEIPGFVVEVRRVFTRLREHREYRHHGISRHPEVMAVLCTKRVPQLGTDKQLERIRRAAWII